MSYYLCAAGETLRAQLAEAFPRADTASNGWIGDASHQASQTSDHNPDWSAGGVVRAIDVDTNLEGGTSAAAMRQFVDQLIAYARAGKDGDRLSYVIYDGKIASGTYASSRWTWRDYSGSDPHTNHAHISFTAAGDRAGARFDLPLFGGTDQEAEMLDEYLEGQNAAQAKYAADGKLGDPPSGKGKYFRAGWNDVRWQANNLAGKDGRDGKDGAAGPQGPQGVAGPPGASHSHPKISVAGPAVSTP